METVGTHAFYCGIDPGHKGAIALLSRDSAIARVWPTPWADADAEYDLAGLQGVFRTLKRFPDVVIGIEWSVAWPGAFANVVRDAENFGRGKAYLEAFAFLHEFTYHRIPPALWKGRLGLKGKQHAGANEAAARLWDERHPQHAGLIRGPRGGLLDGPMDAFLIAEAMRSGALSGRFGQFVALGKRQKRGII